MPPPTRPPSSGPDRRKRGSDLGIGSGRRTQQGSSHIDREDPRTAEEKPCRALFIRNIDNGVDPEHIRGTFAQYGEIKLFYEQVSKRGICFVTYFDLRGATLAKDSCHALEFNGRKASVAVAPTCYGAGKLTSPSPLAYRSTSTIPSLETRSPPSAAIGNKIKAPSSSYSSVILALLRTTTFAVSSPPLATSSPFVATRTRRMPASSNSSIAVPAWQQMIR